MKKQYYNKDAYNYIENKLNETKIDPIFRPIIIDIILRRRYEYQLEDEYFHRDVESFVKNVKNIYVESLPDGITGRFYIKENKIVLSSKLFKYKMNDEDYENILEALSHEVYHAMNYDENEKDRTFENDGSLLISNAGILEIFTEKEANRTVAKRDKRYAFKYRNKTSGYSATTGYLNVIAAAFGIKEKELLQSATKGEIELRNALNRNIKNKNFTNQIFDNMCLNINFAHIEFYRDDDKKFSIRKENILTAEKFLYKCAEQVLDYRIKNLDVNNLEEVRNTLENIKLNQNAITEILVNRFKNQEDRNTVSEYANYLKKIVYAKIISIEEIIRSGNNVSELIGFVKNQQSVTTILEFMEQNNIPVNEELINRMPKFKLTQEIQEKWIKEYCLDWEQWDNREIIEYIKENRNAIKSVKEKNGLRDRIKEMVKSPLRKGGNIEKGNETAEYSINER